MNPMQMTLNRYFLDLKAKNPRLSQRYFAQKLGISSGALNEILKGKRKISAKLANRIAERLQLDPKSTAGFIEKSKQDGTRIEYQQIRDDQFHLISEWQHYGILNLVKSENCQHKPAWFAQQLNLPVKNIQDSLDRLLRLEMLKLENRKYIRTTPHVQTSDDVLNLSIQKSNLEDLEMIKDHMNSLTVDERDLTSITMLLDAELMPEMKKWIRKVQDQFADKFETTQSSQVFRLTMALFPLKKPKT